MHRCIFLLINDLFAHVCYLYLWLGMNWGITPTYRSNITTNGIWQAMFDDANNIHFDLSVARFAVIKYNVFIEAKQNTTQLTDPLLSLMTIGDSLQIRCVVDDVPFRESSSYASLTRNSAATETEYTQSLSGLFAAELLSGHHIISLQWRKLGTHITEWSSNPLLQPFSFVVSTSSDYVWFPQESSDMTIQQSNVWENLTQLFTFDVKKASTVQMDYSVTLFPKQQSIMIKDNSLELISVRILINGYSYVEGLFTHGSSTWNPTVGNMRGYATANVLIGRHSVQLQWKRVGNIFSSWNSRPSYLDGFACGRSVVVSIPTALDQAAAST